LRRQDHISYFSNSTRGVRVRLAGIANRRGIKGFHVANRV